MKTSFKYSIYIPIIEVDGDPTNSYRVIRDTCITFTEIFGDCTCISNCSGCFKNEDNENDDEQVEIIHVITDQNCDDVFEKKAQEIKKLLKQETVLVTKEQIEAKFV